MTRPTAVDRARDGWHQVPLAWRRALVATAVLWLVVWLLTVVAAGILPAQPFVRDAPVPGFPGWPLPPTDAAGSSLLKNALVRYDGLYYLGIAADGYPGIPAGSTAVPNASAFFPLYPALVSALGVLTGGRLLVAAVAVSTAATVAALAGVHRLAELIAGDVVEDDSALARRALVVTALFPTSFFLLAPYPESVHLAAVVWAIVHAARGRALPAAVFGAAAALSRPVGIILVVALLIVWPGTRDGPDPGGSRGRLLRPSAGQLLAVSGPVAGIAGVLLVAWVGTGNPLAPVVAQARWQRTWQSPIDSISDAVTFGLFRLGLAERGYYTLDLLVWVAALVGTVATLVWAVRRSPGRERRVGLAVAAHGVVTAVLWLAQVFPGRPLMSVPRFALVVPAVLLGIALVTERWASWQVWTATSSVLLAVHLVLFSRWYAVF